MKTNTILNLRGVKIPALTHQRIMELKQTSRGKLIMGEEVEAFPALLKSLEKSLTDQLARYDILKRSGRNRPECRLLLMKMLEEHLYWEFSYHIMFIKWRDQRMSKAS